jgi:hypothetical protein
MKKLLLLSLILVVPVLRARSQEFRYKTNEFRLDTGKSQSDQPSDIPIIEWISPVKEMTTSSDNKITLKFTINADTKIRKVQLSIIDSKRGEDLQDKSVEMQAGSQAMEYNIMLPLGYSTVKLTAESENGGIGSSSRNFIIGDKAISESVAFLRHDYALLFATDDYDNWNKLVNPINDTKTIAKELKDNYGFETEVVENPTTDQIMVKIREYTKKDYGKLDQLFIFIAGHGQYDEAFGMGYVVGKNSLRNDPAKTSYISHSNLRDIINNIQCEHIFLAMDVCFGGTFDQKLAGERGGADVYGEVSTAEFVTRRLQYKTRKYITSGGKEYVPDGIPGNNSPFARKMLEALRSYGGPDRVLTLSELWGYVERLEPQPRMGEFGDNKPGSDFIFVSK